MDGSLSQLAEAESLALAGERLAPDHALALLEHADLTTLGALADLARRRLHPDQVVTYVIDRSGKIAAVFDSAVMASQHVDGARSTIQRLRARRT